MAEFQKIPTDHRFHDLTGRQVHRWTVQGYRGKRNGCHRWLCKCECGTEREYTGDQISKNNLRNNCGCQANYWDRSDLTVEQLREACEIIDCPPDIKNRTGQQNGRLTIIGLAGRCADSTYWWAHCECGSLNMLEGFSSNSVLSCGCLAAEKASRAFTKHGMSKNPRDMNMLMRWHSMIARCHKPKSSGYERYGARGISVCERWRQSVLNFVADMGYPQTASHSIEREDNDGNYEPGNCVWATAKQQSQNTRRNILVTRDGRTQCLKAWCEELGLKYQVVLYRVTRYGWDQDRALGTPTKDRFK